VGAANATPTMAQYLEVKPGGFKYCDLDLRLANPAYFVKADSC
jgi:hypothetical protein